LDGLLSEQIPSISTGIAVKREFGGTRIPKKTGFISQAELTWMEKQLFLRFKSKNSVYWPPDTWLSLPLLQLLLAAEEGLPRKRWRI
ncbi:MAG: hypothetical protein ACKOAH_28860, partial [Pirellula sp.]